MACGAEQSPHLSSPPLWRGLTQASQPQHAKWVMARKVMTGIIKTQVIHLKKLTQKSSKNFPSDVITPAIFGRT